MSSGNRKGQWGHSGSCIATVRFFSSILYLRGWSIYEDTILNSEHVYSGKIRDYLALKSLKSTWFAYIKHGISKSILASLISFEVKCLISFLTIYNFKNEDSLQKVFSWTPPPPHHWSDKHIAQPQSHTLVESVAMSGWSGFLNKQSNVLDRVVKKRYMKRVVRPNSQNSLNSMWEKNPGQLLLLLRFLSVHLMDTLISHENMGEELWMSV